jgi:hypothetical protein
VQVAADSLDVLLEQFDGDVLGAFDRRDPRL